MLRLGRVLMGRKRKINKQLPERLYQDAKSGVYYFKPKDGLSYNLGKVYHVALERYGKLISATDTSKKPATHSVGQLIARYMGEVSPSKAPSTHRTNVGRAKFLTYSLGHFGIYELTNKDVREYAYLRFQDATVSVNRELSLLSSIYKQATEWGLEVENPTIGVTRFFEKAAKDAKKIERYITDEELVLLHDASPVWLQLYIELKVITGLRQAGILELKTDAITDDGLFVRQPGKNSRPINFQWTPELKELIQRILAYANKLNSDYLFPNNKGQKRTDNSVRSAWQKAKDKAMKNGLKRPITERYIRNKAVTDNKNSLQSSLIVGHTNLETTIAHYEMKGVEVKNFGKTFKEIKKNSSLNNELQDT